jgi:hypothetical protein
MCKIQIFSSLANFLLFASQKYAGDFLPGDARLDGGDGQGPELSLGRNYFYLASPTGALLD